MLQIKSIEQKTSKDSRLFKVCKVGELPKTINSQELITSIEEKQATVVIWATNKQGVANPSYPRAVVGGILDAEKFTTGTAPYTVDNKVVQQFTGIRFKNESESAAMNRYGFQVDANGQYAKKVATVPTATPATVTVTVATPATPVVENLPV